MANSDTDFWDREAHRKIQNFLTRIQTAEEVTDGHMLRPQLESTSIKRLKRGKRNTHLPDVLRRSSAV